MWAAGSRLRPLLRPQALRLFSNNPACPNPPFSVDDLNTGSAIYRHTLQTQRPSAIQWRKELENSASFIGTVNSPIKTFTSSRGALCVHTRIKVEPPSGSKRFITIWLNMWEDMAEIAVKHLKLNDYIYVSGHLKSFTRALDNGRVLLFPKVHVKEINFVANSNQKTNYKTEDLESTLEKRSKRLYLWQVFFANPYEWQDLRKRKVNPSQPDFKHKGSGEALWLSPFDPPWVTRQLQLQDSRMSEMRLHSSSISSFQL